MTFKLNTFGEKIDSETVTSKILSCLLQKYINFSMTRDSIAVAERTLTILTSRLVKEDARNRDSSKEQAPEAF